MGLGSPPRPMTTSHLCISTAFGEKLHDGVATELELIGHAGKCRQFFFLVVDRLGSQALLAAIDGQLGGGRSGIHHNREVAFALLGHIRHLLPKGRIKRWCKAVKELSEREVITIGTFAPNTALAISRPAK